MKNQLIQFAARSRVLLQRIVRLFARKPTVRRKFNAVGNPELPANPTPAEIASYLKDTAIRQRLQPYGREMDAREWAAVVLESAADDIRRASA
jgi:hypothetical protein